MSTIPDQHLFTVRGRPVMFRKDEDFFGALYATERGWFPLSHTGYISLAQFTNDAVKRTGFFNLLSENFLENIADANQRKTNKVLREIIQCSRRDSTGHDVTHHLKCATRAFDYGLFATDAQRRQLWQAAHETYSKLFDCDSVWLVAEEGQGFLRHIEYHRENFDTLCQCMRGEFTCEKALSHPFALQLAGYFELPPRPEGEPVIPIPSQTLMLDFGE